MPSTRALSVTLVVCVVIGIAFAFTLVGTVAMVVVLLALLGLAAQRVHDMSRRTQALLVAGVCLLPVGWLWHSRMTVYTGFVLMLVAAVLHAMHRVEAAAERRRTASR